MRLEELGFIGNCQAGALVHSSGDVVWCCLPRVDSEPVLGSLLDPDGGGFKVCAADGGVGRQRYLDNTNVLETVWETPDGTFRVVDFFPRFEQHARLFRPTQLFRIIEPISGTPRISVTVDPILGWSKQRPRRIQGSHHLEFEGTEAPLRLTTDLPLAWLEGRPFALTQRKVLALTWGARIEEPLLPLADRFFSETVRYWHRWVKHCNIPTLYQREVIRAALTLKLCCHEDTGAIFAALTTSLPESPGSGRCWDYRYCWLRDSYYVLDALRLLGHFEEREAFLGFLLSLGDDVSKFRPLYRVDGRLDLEEKILPHWKGYEGEGPVRVGNGAVDHLQHDIYGELVLALSPMFLDERFRQERTPATLRLLERLARRALEVALTPDAGIWELRSTWEPQTFSSLMCWAAAERTGRIGAKAGAAWAKEISDQASALHARVMAEAFNPALDTFTRTSHGKDLDASLLQMVPLRFLPANDRRVAATVDAVRRDLGKEFWLQRYQMDDSFGTPTVAFTICTFWLVSALASIGRKQEALEVLERTTQALSPLGLLSEDVDPKTGRLWGNFPQAYSAVGLIHAAFSASPTWSELL